VQVHYLTGVILGGQERYAEATRALERTVALNPTHVIARFKLALAYLRLGDHARAERILQAVVTDEPRNMRAYQNLAAIAYSRGDLQRAEQMARRATEIDAGYFDAWNTLGATYLMMKRPTDALDALTKAVAARPESGQAHHNLALAYQARGDAQAAADARARACRLDARFCG
jgi:Flp pilus assembly protein TadD